MVAESRSTKVRNTKLLRFALRPAFLERVRMVMRADQRAHHYGG
jgi:hypothetical protein